MDNKTTNKNNKESLPLNEKQKRFCQYYVELGNACEAAIRAGYSKKTVGAQSSRLLKDVRISREIRRLGQPQEEHRIATAQEVMEFFTRMMNGEIEDQFGLDATNSDKIKAAQELAKRTVDVENRAAGKADQKVEINLNWKRD